MERLTESDRCDSILEKSSLSPIQNFYNGQSIFVTGGTGFMGKILIEKLLRECPGISFIYMLIRPKKGKDMHQRIEELFDDPVRISIIFFSISFFFFYFSAFSIFYISIFSHFYTICLNSFIFLLNSSTKYFSKHYFSFRHYILIMTFTFFRQIDYDLFFFFFIYLSIIYILHYFLNIFFNFAIFFIINSFIDMIYAYIHTYVYIYIYIYIFNDHIYNIMYLCVNL